MLNSQSLMGCHWHVCHSKGACRPARVEGPKYVAPPVELVVYGKCINEVGHG